MARDYKERAGMPVAERFIAAVEEALRFIEQNPYACSLYDPGKAAADLHHYTFRKWSLRGFPHLVLFRLSDSAVYIEALYAHKMNVSSRLIDDFPL